MMVVKLGWDSTFVMPVKDAVTLAGILTKAHTWKEEYNNGNGATYHAYPMETKVQMELVSEDMFRMAKLAGKPEKK